MLFVISALCFAQNYSAEAKFRVPIGEGEQIYTVSRVVDGDTFKLSNGQTLKLAGINAPDIHDTTTLTQQASKLGKEVWSYRTVGVDGQKMVQRIIDAAEGKIKIEPETQSFNDNGAMFAYVFVQIAESKRSAIPEIGGVESINGSVNIFLNAYLVGMGFAEAVSPDAKYKDFFEALEQKSKTEKKGIWA